MSRFKGEKILMSILEKVQLDMIEEMLRNLVGEDKYKIIRDKVFKKSIIIPRTLDEQNRTDEDREI